MKKFLALVLALTMILSVAAASADGVTISFFDKNSGTKTFDDPRRPEADGGHRRDHRPAAALRRPR